MRNGGTKPEGLSLDLSCFSLHFFCHISFVTICTADLGGWGGGHS